MRAVPFLFAALLSASLASAQEDASSQIQTAEAGAVKVHYVRLPWGPETFAGMERGEDSYYNRRSWPFARMETHAALTLDGTRVAPGNYALVFHPNGADKKGMSLELRKIDVPEFLQPGNAMTPTPAGETVYRAPVAFTTESETVPTLALSLAESKGAVGLEVRYGNRKLTKELKP